MTVVSVKLFTYMFSDYRRAGDTVMRTFIISTAAILFVLINSANAYLPVIDLGPGIAYSINDNGQVVGSNYYDPLYPECAGGS